MRAWGHGCGTSRCNYNRAGLQQPQCAVCIGHAVHCRAACLPCCCCRCAQVYCPGFTEHAVHCRACCLRQQEYKSIKFICCSSSIV
jgi:hypothetical protein